MKSIAFLIFTGFCCTALAQPAKAPAEKPQAAKEAKPAAKVAAAEGRKSRRAEDARHCLDKTSNTEIIKCAEAYL